VLDDRIGGRSTFITSQLPVKAWHTYLDDPTLADAPSTISLQLASTTAEMRTLVLGLVIVDARISAVSAPRDAMATYKRRRGL
jgi:hypothetical protein